MKTIRIKAALLVGGNLLVTGFAVSPALAADECLSKPNAAPGQGQHWYYRLDRANQRKCWYLGATGQNVRRDQDAPAPVARKKSATPAAEKDSAYAMAEPPPAPQDVWPAPATPAPNLTAPGFTAPIPAPNLPTPGMQTPGVAMTAPAPDTSAFAQRRPVEAVMSAASEPDPDVWPVLDSGANDQPAALAKPMSAMAQAVAVTGELTPLRLALIAAGILFLVGFLLRLTLRFVSKAAAPQLVPARAIPTADRRNWNRRMRDPDMSGF
jgi:hypothetical protein